MADNPIEEESGLDADTATDRRRPGRRNDVSPNLIPLLRRAARERFSLPWITEDHPDQLSAARGLLIAMLIGAVVWFLIGLVIWAVI